MSRQITNEYTILHKRTYTVAYYEILLLRSGNYLRPIALAAACLAAASLFST